MKISAVNNSLESIRLGQNNKPYEVKENSFKNILNESIKSLNKEQVEGYEAMKGIATGKVTNLQDAVRQIEEAELSLRLALEVKNKVINALREISKMQI